MARTDPDVAKRAEFLKQVGLFADCGKAELALVAGKAKEIRVPSGSTIVQQGSAGDAFYVLAEGLAYVHVDGQKVASISAGSFFGEMALIDHQPRSASVTAELPSRLLQFGEKDFPAIRAIPSVSEKVLAAMSKRLRTANQSNQEP